MMKKWLKLLRSILFIAAICMGSFCRLVYASGGSELPPVDIAITTPANPCKAGEDFEIKIKITPQEDMHADVSCFLPNGVKPVMQKGVMIRPFQNRHGYNNNRKMEYQYTAGLYVGPLKAGEAKEFIFHVKIPDNGHYEIICVVDALAKWGSKEGSHVVEVE